MTEILKLLKSCPVFLDHHIDDKSVHLFSESRANRQGNPGIYNLKGKTNPIGMPKL